MELMQLRQRGERGFYCEMDATFNGLESEADGGVGVGGCATADAEKGERRH